MKYKLFLLFFLIFSYKLYAHEYYCNNISNLEKFKKINSLKLKTILSDEDSKIYERIFKLSNLELIGKNHDKKQSTCKITYTFNPISKEEAIGYLYSIEDKRSEFKKIISILANANDKEKASLSNEINNIINKLPYSIYTTSTNDLGEIDIKVDSFSFFVFIESLLQK